jgi:hypothetical protein
LAFERPSEVIYNPWHATRKPFSPFRNLNGGGKKLSGDTLKSMAHGEFSTGGKNEARR